MDETITQRQEEILESIIRKYIELAKPVSSKLLKEEVGFSCCSATLRTEMFVLTQKGYLEQPHVSAGRVPTDKGYKFFVKKVKEKKVNLPNKLRNLFENFRKRKKLNKVKDFDYLADEVAKINRVFVSFYFPERGIHLKRGWIYLRQEPESEFSDFWRDFTEIIEKIDELLEEIEDTPDWPQVMIGKDLPVETKGYLAMITSPLELEGYERCFFSLIGPKRMTYDRNLAIMESAIKNLNYEG
jgi:transcriptional regulator of heat shock response